MKKYLPLLLSFIFATAGSFQMLGAIPAAGGDSDFEESEDATYIPAMILVEDADVSETIAELESQGVTVLRHRENILLTYIPVDWQPERRAVKGVRSVEYSKPRFNKPLMNQARFFNNADFISQGYNLPQPYDGKGVVVGVCDIGIDTRHPNFLTSDGKECRIRKVVHYQELQGLRTEYNTPEEIYEWRTDTRDNWHATHVTGIAAGSSPVETASGQSYRSLAPEADIVFTASMLSDVGLLAGVEDIIEYAKSVKKPAVINLSMGNYLGPHDGTSLFTRYLDLCADDAIICLSAGNEGGRGDSPISMSYDFTDTKKVLCIRATDWDGIECTGEAEVWSKDSTPFGFNFYLNNGVNAALNVSLSEPLFFSKDGLTEWRISADPDDPDYNEILAQYYYEGYVRVTGGISPLNGRYYVNMEFDLNTDIYREGQTWAAYWEAMRIEAEPGTHVDIYCSNGSFLRSVTGYPAGDNKQNISDLATGFRTISVGMMNNTDRSADPVPGSGNAKGDINPNSGYGTLTIDGRVLPLTVAPGADIMSSVSGAFIEEYPENIPYVDDTSVWNGQNYYWVATNGTSMSCPFVVSAIATWLQAFPNLTSDQAVEIVEKSNQTSGYPDASNPRHGRGWFNAYGGLQKVLELAALNVGTIEDLDIIVKWEKGNLLIANPSGEKIGIVAFCADGKEAGRFTVNETLATLPLYSLGKGIYVIRVSMPDGRSKSIKVII